ncbi:MAG: NAD(P)/FAD-dependent oxidoreductase [Myxococcales bacterium]|nr:NAD(P)/FAD-dependent oxidoreductase [Myxococcales bacterium]
MTHIVVGAGASGLVAAIELARRGHPVTVLEASADVGGRARSEIADGFTTNLGPHALYANAERHLAELGVRVAGGIPKSAGLTMQVGDRVTPLPVDPLSLLGNGGLGWDAKWKVGSLLGRIGWMNAEALDAVPVATWLDTLGAIGVARDVLEATVRVSTYTNAPERLSAGAAVRQLRRALEGVRYLDGGWQTIVEGLLARAKGLGVAVRTRAKVVAVDDAGVHLADGDRLEAEGVVLTLSPKATVRLLGERARPSLAAFAERAVAVRAACLDVALRRLPRRHPTLILGTDRPLYLSVHSESAALAPRGGGLIHVARYLAPDERVTAETRAELEALLDLGQPGWREQIVRAHWAGAMTVMQAIPEAKTGGLAGRPTVADAGPANVALAGDWVGDDGMLLDAAIASARAAASHLAERAERAAA